MDTYFFQMYFIILSTVFVISAGSSLAGSTIWTLDKYENITRIKRQTGCGETKFECQNGECINKEQICDGVTNCNDGSDETEKVCGGFKCTTLFRCDYGACVNAQAKCNGIKECADGSDESHCDEKTFPVPSKSPPPIDGSCLMPKNPSNGVYAVGIYNAGLTTPGEYVPPFSALVLSCNPQYKPSPPQLKAIPLCLNGKWTVTPLTCASYCAVPKLPTSTKVTCKFKGRILNSCEDAVEGTILTLKCAPLYEEPGISDYPNRICRDGYWNYPLSQCIPGCGEKRPAGIPDVIGSQIAKEGDYPWHVGIYSRSSNNSLICGGSIINQRVILTAAHCIADNDGHVQPKEDYLVAAGKYYRPYDDPRDRDAQYSEVHSIHKAERYRGIITDFGSDIAVIILKDAFKITKRVLPVCVDWNSNFEDEQLTENNIGVVVGWGYSDLEGNSSEGLKEIELPYKSYPDCFNNVPKNFRKFITSDKICAGYLSANKSVCQGDTGAGLTFPWHKDRYYIRGIVSTSPTINVTGIVTCNPNQYSTYTLVSKHLDFIIELETYYRPLVD